MLRSLVTSARRLFNDFNRAWANRLPHLEMPAPRIAASVPRNYERLERVLLTDEANRTILDEFAAHRRGARGDEETGWFLLGVRGQREATVLATLPAGTGADTGIAHVRFNSDAQALASRIVRQWDRRLVHLGVLHTHPGSLRHPSDGDYRGDIQWVRVLRGREGIFGIGTAEALAARNGNGAHVAYQPQRHMQILDELCLSWYSLRDGDHGYRPLEVGVTLGPDLARPLRPVWPAIETHAEELDRLCCQQAGIAFEMLLEDEEPVLALTMKLAGPKESLRVLLNNTAARYYLIRDTDVIEVDPREERIDRSVYLILAELAS